MNLTDHDREILVGKPPHEQAMLLLRGRCGPLIALPFDPDVAALGYLIHLVFRRARRPGEMLSGRPAYEAAETLLGRVLSVGPCAESLQEFGHRLFERLGLSTASLHPDDAVWWIEARRAYADRWRYLADPMALTDAVQAARLLDELLFDLRSTPEEPSHA